MQPSSVLKPKLKSGNFQTHHSASHNQPSGGPVLANGRALYDSQTLHQNEQSMQGLVNALYCVFNDKPD